MAMEARSCRQALKDATAHWPHRNKAGDGILPSAEHHKRNPKSDHERGEAVDITHDPVNGPDGNKWTQELIKSKDSRVKYIIWNRRIWYPTSNGPRPAGWSDYHGTNPHDHHFHISIKPGHRDDLSPWPWTVTKSAVSVLQSPAVSSFAPSADFSAEPQQKTEEDIAKGVTQGDTTEKSTEGGPFPPTEAVEIKASRPTLKSVVTSIFLFVMAPLSYIGIDIQTAGRYGLEYAKNNFVTASKIGFCFGLVVLAVWFWKSAMANANTRTLKMMDLAGDKDRNNVRLVGGKDPVPTIPPVSAPGAWKKDSDSVQMKVEGKWK